MIEGDLALEVRAAVVAGTPPEVEESSTASAALVRIHCRGRSYLDPVGPVEI